MNQCFGCSTCKSADKPLEGFIADLPMETSHHRVEGQSAKCGFGLQGVCCRLCSNGPCRITPKAPRGICGATADVIVTRNFLRAVASGSGCYIHIVENTALNVLKTAQAKGGLKGLNALNYLADEMGIVCDDIYEKAEKVARKVLDDLYKPEYEKMELVEKLAYAPRFQRWKELGILPGGAKGEVFHGVVKCSTNLNSDPVDMLTDCLKLGISTGLYGLTLTNLLNDILLGEPEIRMAPVGLRVIDPEYINIMITGHQHTIFVDLQEKLKSPEAVAKAQAAGAKGFKLVGCTCVGQDLQLRGAHYTEVFEGHAGNNYTSEAVLATGGIDAVLSEFNCTLPGIEPICDELKIKQICLDDVAKKANAKMMPFDFDRREEQSMEIIDEIVEAYKARRGNVPMNLFPEHGNDDTLTGVSEVSLKKFLGDTWKPLIDLIVSGDIKGIAGVVGCSNLTAGGHDVLSVELTKELIAKDILVLTAGCSSGGLENCGLMEPSAAKLAGPKLRAVCEKLGIPPVLNFGPCLAIGRLEIVATELAKEIGVDLPQLPLVLSAAQWLEEQAPGRFKVEVSPNGQLGDSPDMVAGVKLGTLTMEFDLSSVVSSVSGPATSAVDLPYLYPTYEDWVQGTFENGGLELFNETLAPSGYYCVGMFYNGMRQVISRTSTYHNSEDLHGQKIRVAQNDLDIKTWDAMGGSPTPMSWNEVLTSLSTGTIEALDHSLGVFNDFNIHEIAPYITITNHASSPFPIVCSLEWIESLDPEDRALIEEGVALACEQQREEERANEMEYIERFKEEGATVEELTDEEVAAFKEAVQPVYDDLRAQIGDDLMDRWLATVPQS